MLKGPIHILINNATVQSLVEAKEREGATGKYKVYPVVAPMTEQAPYVVVRQTGGAPLGKNCGSTVQFVCASYHTSYDEVVALDNAVIAALSNAASATYNGVSMSSISEINLSVDEFVVEHKLYAKLSTFQAMVD